jgi:multimeric flavodoxin WrbA
MKVLGICGSPREGNSELLLRAALDGAEEAGAETELVLLREKHIGYCDGCATCEEGGEREGECHIEDDMQPLYRKLEEADAIVLASPNYYSNVSGLMKSFIDRMLVFYSPRKEKLRGKRGGIIAVGGENGKPAIDAMKVLFSANDIVLVGTVDASASHAGDVAKDKEALKAAAELGRKLASD